MPAAARVTDSITTGHACDTTSTIGSTLQSTVTITGKLGAVKGSPIAPHTILSGSVCVPHSAVVNAGSSTVKLGGIPASRVNDSADGGIITSGSSKVTIGG